MQRIRDTVNLYFRLFLCLKSAAFVECDNVALIRCATIDSLWWPSIFILAVTHHDAEHILVLARKHYSSLPPALGDCWAILNQCGNILSTDARLENATLAIIGFLYDGSILPLGSYFSNCPYTARGALLSAYLAKRRQYSY